MGLRILSIFGLFLLLGLYAVFLEPVWLEVSRYRVPAKVAAPLKLAHLSDLHLKTLGTLEEKVIRALESEKPDLIVLTGDDVGERTNFPELLSFLRSLHAPLGVWAIRGNWENWQKVPVNAYEGTGVTILINESRRIRDDVILVGFDDPWTGAPNRDLASVSKELFRIALFHTPGFFDEVAGDCDLALSGHTHGGQVRLPFFGPIWLPEGSGNYTAGWFEKGASKMYVSRGLGTSIVPMRFLSRPELPIYEIFPEKS